MATTEHTINDAIAATLRDTRKAWRADGIVNSENSGMLTGSAKQPDILVLETTASPVVIETEVLPAINAEAEAAARLGEHVRNTGRTILSAVAVRLPTVLRKRAGVALRNELEKTAEIEMAVYTGSSPYNCVRWPRAGWLRGGIGDLSLLVQSASVPPDVIEKAADELVAGVSESAGLLSEMAQANPGAMQKICIALRQHDAEQTRRMATTILANAFVFQESLAGGPGALGDVRSVAEMRSAGAHTKAGVLDEWRKVLKVNYWPIFDIARRILEAIPAGHTKLLLDRLATTAERLVENRLMRSHDLTGAVFQKLIADRKFLAAYYTTPASAALLVGLTITQDVPLSARAWASAEKVDGLRVGDLACGTGTLLSTAYQRLGQLHELAGGDAEARHPKLMQSSLVGCDVLPAAAHLTASMLAGAHPTIMYSGSSILTMPYGRQVDGSVALGSLDLLNPQKKFEMIEITAKSVGATGESEADTWSELPDEMFDVIVMNPPFTRSTGHEAEKIGIPRPMFAAFGSTEDEQRLMAEATKELTRGTSAHGNAGEASIFLVLAHRKVKQNGRLALVMPLSLISGEAWEASRALLARNYGGLTLVSIAGASADDMSFSADTGMGECLVVGTRTAQASTRATFVVLRERPAYPLLGSTAANQIRAAVESGSLRRLEDGPLGGTPLFFGDDVIGYAIEAPIPTAGPWNPSRISDLALAQAAYQLSEGRVWLPTMSEAQAVPLPISTVGKIGKVGPYHSDVNGKTAGGGIRGPFNVRAVQPDATPTYPILWSHHAERERTMQFVGDKEGQAKQAKKHADKAIIQHKITSIWNTASHCHFNENFQFNSQSTAMQFTPHRTIGGRAWKSIQLASENHEKALVAWANTSLGLLLHWYYANKQQAGRGSIGILALADLPVLDVTKLSARRLDAAVKVFDAFSQKALRPVNELDQDETRAELDRRFALEVLGLPEHTTETDGPLELLRRKLAQEPSIRGTKETEAADEHDDDDES